MSDIYSDIDFHFFCQDKLMENIRDISRHSDRWNFRCPICGDSSKSKSIKRGWYYIKTNSTYCWNDGCPASGSGISILKYLSILTGQSIGELKFDFIRSKNKIKTRQKKKEKPVQEQEKKIELQDSWVEPDDTIKKYIDYRKVLEAPFAPKNWQFYFDKKTQRLVIPWLIKNKMESYQLRAIYKKQDPKYKFPFDVDKPVFGLDKIDDSLDYIFLLEGGFDSIWVQNGVAIGGINPTEKQKNILSTTLKETVLMLDNQWLDKTSMKKTITLAKKYPTKKMFIWDRKIKAKDVNEFIIKVGIKNNPFLNYEWIKSRIFSGLGALMELKMQ